MRAHEFLFEYNQAKTVQQFGSSIATAYLNGPDNPGRTAVDLQDPQAVQSLAAQVLTALEKGDPTRTKTYVPWLAREYARGNIARLEDTGRFVDTLAAFEANKRKQTFPQGLRDIMRLTADQFLDGMEQYIAANPDPKTQAQQRDQTRGQAQEVFRQGNLRVIVPNDETAACYYGQGTRWCTAAKNNNMFDEYSEDGDLYILMFQNLGGQARKFQMHPVSGQFMDEKDRDVSKTDIKLMSADPAYTSFLNQMIEKYYQFEKPARSSVA